MLFDNRTLLEHQALHQLVFAPGSSYGCVRSLQVRSDKNPLPGCCLESL